ncbi:MAG: class I SAM-dependent methyltransferase [Chloroflexi bacterium]|nr:class I SAM-dependent methyltransferase [Chloroflexota bacterium]
MNQELSVPTHDAYPTAQPTPDTLGLGRTSGQRGAEIIAGFRAEQHPSADTLALSRWTGRVTARWFMRMPGSKATMNYLVTRLATLSHLIQETLPPAGDDLTIVDLACGLSPRGLTLARALPHVTVIEIDLPDVVRDKQQRLKQARDVVIPPNIQWLAADLGVVSLGDVLGGRQVNAVCAEGLNPYFSDEKVVAIARHIHASLKPGGVYVCDLPWRNDNNAQGKQVANVYSRQAGVYLCTPKDEAEARQVMLDAGFASVDVYPTAQFADALELPQPIMEFSLFVRARKATV